MIMIILVSLAVGVGVGLIAGRFAIPLAMGTLMLAFGPLAALWVYETYIYTSGDTSSYGLLSMILLIALGPCALAMMITGFLRGI